MSLPISSVHRSGYIAVVGRPNVGKSTLVNALIGHKVAITSPKPQTTRKRILGILTQPDVQMLFTDTPGIHKPRRALGKYMMREVDTALADCDAILFVVDVSVAPTDEDKFVAEMIARAPQPKLLAMNKSDQCKPKFLIENTAEYQALMNMQLPALVGAPSTENQPGPNTHMMLTSATRGDNLGKLMAMLIETLPEGPEFYPADQYTDQSERVIAAELIREQVLQHLEQEVPHAVAVSIDEWQLRKGNTVFVAATIFVERDTQKGILIGKGGTMLKTLGSTARAEIEREMDIKIFLELWVKVRADWRDNDSVVERFLSDELNSGLAS